MSWLLVAALAVAGLAIGWCLRTVVVRLAVPAGEPALTCCPACGHQTLPGGRRPPPESRPETPPESRPETPPESRPETPPESRPETPPESLPKSRPARARAATAANLRLRRAVSPSGRCAACRTRVGPPPFAVEVSTAVLLGVLAARVHPGLVLAAACWLALCAVPLAWIDSAVQRLPDALTAPAYAGTMGLLLLAAASSGHWHDMLRAVIGGLALAAAYLALAILSRAAIGLGDAKLAASLGTMLAWAGWPVPIAGTFAGFLLAAVYGIGLLALRRTSWRQRIPFGPFMIAGAFLALVITAGTVSAGTVS